MIKVLVVEDSLIMRKILSKIFAATSLFSVQCAADPYEARQVIKQFEPDVITLDIEMPRMDGVTFLRNLMKLNPLPVVMLSTLTQKGAEATLIAMEMGAIDFIGKPKADSSNQGLEEFAESLTQKVKVAAASYQIIKNNRLRSLFREKPTKISIPPEKIKGKVIGIGASTGGVEAIKLLLTNLSTQLPPIVITQHLPKSFSKKFADRLNGYVTINVKEAAQGEELLPGCVYIAKSTQHLQIISKRGKYFCALDNGPKVNFHRPSVDVMFDSLSSIAPENLLLVLLTGMGKDGAVAMRNQADKGAFCIIQDQQTSVVWGMPGSAYALGCADKVLPLTDIGKHIENHYR
ncbi:MAG: chemotaxis response regulator protein-glutamate methylesterase [Oceanospirillaceae bacterium]|nr:chemotaxis response regulator protein-glutamate methylesterase [Oceanospirillaceae bacterium]